MCGVLFFLHPFCFVNFILVPSAVYCGGSGNGIHVGRIYSGVRICRVQARYASRLRFRIAFVFLFSFSFSPFLMRVMMTVIAFLYQPFAGGYGYTGNLAREASVAAAFNNDGKGFDVVINCVGPRVPVSILSMVKSKWRTSHLMAYSPHASHSAHTLRLPGVPINYYAAPIPIAQSTNSTVVR